MRTSSNLLLLILVGTVLSCGGKEKNSETTVPNEDEAKPTVYVPPPTEHLEGTPFWVRQSHNWPALAEWPVGPDGNYTYDSVSLHLSGSVIQSFVSGPKGKDHPIMCWFELTARPIPRQLVGYSFNIDSVIFYDPIKKKNLPTLPMLSSERTTEKGVVRTRFTNNLAVMHTPSVVENQLVNPTVYISSVEKKSVKLTLPPMNISFIREFKQEEVPDDSLKWGPG